jgi:hypothetical protein
MKQNCRRPVGDGEHNEVGGGALAANTTSRRSRSTLSLTGPQPPRRPRAGHPARTMSSHMHGLSRHSLAVVLHLLDLLEHVLGLDQPALEHLGVAACRGWWSGGGVVVVWWRSRRWWWCVCVCVCVGGGGGLATRRGYAPLIGLA